MGQHGETLLYCSPQPLQSWLVYAGGTAITRRPAYAVCYPWFAATLSTVRDEGDTGYRTLLVTRTQMQPLALTGLPPIPAAGRRFSATFEATVGWCGDQVARISPEPIPPSILEQPGVQLPG